jgi:ribosomal-protein-alanine N-acetyltransferase
MIRDVKEVIKIEQDSFPTPWEMHTFMRLALARGHLFLKGNSELNFHVLEREGCVIGYVAWESNFTKGIGHILNLAVRSDQRKRGYGTQLFDHAIRWMKDGEIESAFLEVRENNQSAISLYEKMGMTASDRVRGYYGDIDAIIYRMSL